MLFPRPSKTTMLFPRKLQLLFLLLLSTHTYSEVPNCQHFQCGDLNITYPFSRYNPQDNLYCGYPGLLVSCEYGTAYLHLQSNIYTVLSINYYTRTITLLGGIDILDQNNTCPKINSFSFSPNYGINYTGSVQDLTFFYNCSQFGTNYSPIKCLSNTVNRSSYVIPTNDIDTNLYDALKKTCDQVVMVPVQTYYLNQCRDDLDVNFDMVLKTGFQLEWNVIDECCNCETKLKGQCVYSVKNDSIFVPDCFCHGEDSKMARNIILGLLFVMVSLILLSVLPYLFCYKGRYLGITKNIKGQSLQNFGALAPKRYTFYEIREMTKSFSERIGKGGYGSVYKGKLIDGTLVAVKVLKDRKFSNGDEVINEVASIARTSHVNIVRLLGFSIEGMKRALIYEYMPNGSLDRYLRESRQNSTLSHDECARLFDIALGIARGLGYLHRGCNTRIIHFDIKPHNILLDQDYCPKISDFGLAKFCLPKESIISISGMRGTVGYIAPEVFSRNFGVVSSKSDVYSFGMLILEMFGVKRKALTSGSCSETYFPDYICKCLEESTICSFYSVSDASKEIFQKVMIIGLWCIQVIPDARPTMSRVLDMLDRGIEDLIVPPKLHVSVPQVGMINDSNVSIS